MWCDAYVHSTCDAYVDCLHNTTEKEETHHLSRCLRGLQIPEVFDKLSNFDDFAVPRLHSCCQGDWTNTARNDHCCCFHDGTSFSFASIFFSALRRILLPGLHIFVSRAWLVATQNGNCCWGCVLW
eukprot:PhF_6_TR20505/c1_g1_i2/m.29556